MSDKEKQDDSGGQNDVWPGDEPKAPKPGTETDGPEPGETTFVPIVR
jgi:hypothetical protein